MCGGPVTAATLWRLSLAAVAASIAQVATLAAQYAAARAPTLLACLICAIVALLALSRYAYAISRHPPSELRAAKYTLIAQLLAATWYVLVGLTTYLLHTIDVSVLSLIFGGGSSGGSGATLSSQARAIIGTQLAATALSAVADAWSVWYHSAFPRWGALEGGRESAPARAASIIVLLCDVVVLALTIAAYTLHRDHGAIALIAIVGVSLLTQARYAWRAWRGDATTCSESWHFEGHMLAFQHVLFLSLVFLVNVLLLLLAAAGTSIAAIVRQDTSAEGAQLIVSVIAYAVLLVTVAALVGLQARLESGSHAHDLDAAYARISTGAGGGGDGGGAFAVPVALLRGASGVGWGGNGGSSAVAVPLG